MKKMTDKKFEEWPFQVPNFANVGARLKGFAELFAKASSPEEALKIWKKTTRLIESVEDKITHVSVLLSLETTNKKYEKAMKKINNAMPLLEIEMQKLSKAYLESPYLEFLEGKLGKLLTKMYQYDIWASYSTDLIHWGEAELLLGVEDVPFATFKIGVAAPPVETERGFLLFFHSVDNDPAREIVYPNGTKWCSRYTCGAVLLDKQDPFRVIAMTRKPLLVPEMDYETGNMELFWRENVIFPCGAVPVNDEKTLRIYYGAGDYSTNLAEIDFADLKRELTPCSRLAERATVPFRIEDWKR